MIILDILFMHQQSGESLRDRVSNNKQRFHFGAKNTVLMNMTLTLKRYSQSMEDLYI